MVEDPSVDAKEQIALTLIWPATDPCFVQGQPQIQMEFGQSSHQTSVMPRQHAFSVP